MDVLDPNSRFLAAGLHVFVALVWATLARSFWRSHGTCMGERCSVLFLFRLLSTIFAVHFASNVVIDLVSPPTDATRGLFDAGCAFSGYTTLALLPVLRHLIPLGALGGPRPGFGWLAVNYGSAVVVIVFDALLQREDEFEVNLYLVLMTAVILWETVKLARRGWQPVMMADLRPIGFLALAVALVASVAVSVVTERISGIESLGWALNHVFLGLAVAAPFALRILGELVRLLLVHSVWLGAATGICFAASALLEGQSDPVILRLIKVGALLALVLILGPGGAWLSATVDRLVLPQRHRWREDLKGFLRTLSPRLGVPEACRRATAEVSRALRPDGVAILLDGSGDSPAAGRLDIDKIAAVWGRLSEPGAPALPESAFDLLWLADGEVQSTLYESRITWVVPILSPRKRWGHLFVAAGFWGTAAGADKLEILESFCRELALVLDAADLLERSVRVERELAQAEKLAALGETAARIAHEIRNPITAARSLAQLMSGEPTSPLNAEHAGLVVRELDRVERQVQSLLQFARRESHRPERVDLAQLVGSTLADLEKCVDTQGVEIGLDLLPGVIAEVDPERFRQVVINLVTNAVDALEDSAAPRRLEVSVGLDGEEALLSVKDSGPGIEDDLLPRIFEPFVSRKTQGTGLGLAIARRIVESHGGRIAARSAEPRGSIFEVRVPAVVGVPLRRAV